MLDLPTRQLKAECCVGEGVSNMLPNIWQPFLSENSLPSAQHTNRALTPASPLSGMSHKPKASSQNLLEV